MSSFYILEGIENDHFIFNDHNDAEIYLYINGYEKRYGRDELVFYTRPDHDEQVFIRLRHLWTEPKSDYHLVRIEDINGIHYDVCHACETLDDIAFDWPLADVSIILTASYREVKRKQYELRHC